MTADLLSVAPIVPLVQADDPSIAVATAKALKTGGLNVIEVVLRTDAALASMDAIIKEAPEVIVGAGTVISVEQAKEALARGAKFIVSPGLHDDIVQLCKERDVAVYPGVVTPSEVMRAWNLGLRTVKFFPAGLSGGPPMLKALSSVFKDVRFMPTGGVSAENLKDYLTLKSVVACGGSWLTPAKEIQAGNFDAITNLAREALAIAKEVKSRN